MQFNMGQTLSEPVTEKVCGPRVMSRESPPCDVGPRPGIAHGPHTVMEGRAVAMIT